ncbi:MAG TPA: hypothetical protein VLL07_05390 [Pontiella sp.]|nr:hypothetical protein [Pontiella sp.]
MRRSLYIRKIILFSWMIAFLLSLGCSSLKKPGPAYPTLQKDVQDELTDAERKEIASMIVLVDDSEKAVNLDGFHAGGKGQGTAVGAVVGVPVTVITLGMSGNGLGLVIIYFFPEYVVAGGAVIGAGYGLVVSEPKQEMEQAMRTARESIDELSVGDLLAGSFKTPADSSIELQAYSLRESAASVSHTDAACSAFQSKLVVKITEVGTHKPRGKSKSLFSTVVDVRISARVQLVRTRDKKTLYEATYLYWSSPEKQKKFREWAAEDGRLFRAEILHGLGKITDSINSDILEPFKSHTPEPAATENVGINAPG